VLLKYFSEVQQQVALLMLHNKEWIMEVCHIVEYAMLAWSNQSRDLKSYSDASRTITTSLLVESIID